MVVNVSRAGVGHFSRAPKHDNLMGQIDAAVQAFCTTTGKLGVVDNVTTFTESEFGRTGNRSSSNGSDPAWDSHHLVLSGKVNGGQAFGTFPTLGVGAVDPLFVSGAVCRHVGMLVWEGCGGLAKRLPELQELRRFNPKYGFCARLRP